MNLVVFLWDFRGQTNTKQCILVKKKGNQCIVPNVFKKIILNNVLLHFLFTLLNSSFVEPLFAAIAVAKSFSFWELYKSFSALSSLEARSD